MSELSDQLRQPSGYASLDDERSRAADEIERLTSRQRCYYRCECGGLIVRGPSNDSPCEVCGRPLANELCVDVHWWIEAQNAKAEIARLQAIVDRLPKTADGVLYANYTPATGVSGFALWRYTGEDQVRVSPCHRPDDPDESATGHAWIIDDCEDECEVIGVYSTREAAEQGRQT